MQSEKLKWQSEYIKYHNLKPFIAPADSYRRTEEKLLLEELPERCSNIIDYCCGTGRIATLVASEEQKVLALDQSIESLKKSYNQNCSPICCLAQKTPIKEKWADCVFFIQALQYIPLEEQSIIFQELNRLLKTNGKLIISTFCYDAVFLKIGHILFNNRWTLDGVEYGSNGFQLPYHRFKKSELKIKLHDAGFEITSMKLLRNYPIHLLSPNIDYIMARVGLKLFGSQIIISAKKVW
jgi:SAM-dependent methyltransferase